VTRPLPPHDSLGEALAAAAPDAPPQMVASVMATLRAERMRAAAPILRPRRRLSRPWRRFVLALTLLLLAGGAAGAARASATALPGTVLYGVREIRENVTLALAPTDTARGSLALGYAQDRIVAMHRIVAAYGDLGVAGALLGDAVDYNRQATAAGVPWLSRALDVQVAAAGRDCTRLWRDPAWQRVSGLAAGRHTMDAHLAALKQVAGQGTR